MHKKSKKKIKRKAGKNKKRQNSRRKRSCLIAKHEDSTVEVQGE